jgi:hypothetical protein
VLECDGSYTLLQQSEEEAYVAVAGWGIGPQNGQRCKRCVFPAKF